MSGNEQLPFGIQAAGDFLDAAYKKFSEFLDDAIPALFGKIGELLGGIGGKVKELGTSVKQGISNLRPSSTPAITPVKKEISAPQREITPEKEISSPSPQIQEMLSCAGLDFGNSISNFGEIDSGIRGCATPTSFMNTERAASRGQGMQITF